jgi:hypothetical protein
LNGQLDPQPLHGHRKILSLTAPLARLSADATRPMDQHDRGFDLVAMLPARSTAALTSHLAL